MTENLFISFPALRVINCCWTQALAKHKHAFLNNTKKKLAPDFFPSPLPTSSSWILLLKYKNLQRKKCVFKCCSVIKALKAWYKAPVSGTLIILACFRRGFSFSQDWLWLSFFPHVLLPQWPSFLPWTPGWDSYYKAPVSGRINLSTLFNANCFPWFESRF